MAEEKAEQQLERRAKKRGNDGGKGKGKGRRARRRFCNRTLSRRWRCKETNVFMYCSILKSVVKSFTLLLPASLSLSRASWRFSWRCETEYPMGQHSDPLQFRSYLKTYFVYPTRRRRTTPCALLYRRRHHHRRRLYRLYSCAFLPSPRFFSSCLFCFKNFSANSRALARFFALKNPSSSLYGAIFFKLTI